jgi:hypothetical protein
MVKQLIVDLENRMNSDIFSLAESSSEFEEWVHKPKKILNLPPLI